MAQYIVYPQRMLYLGYGTALYDPDPAGRYDEVRIGDVGYVQRGAFHRLFNITFPLDHEVNRLGVPEGFEPLSLTDDDTFETTRLSSGLMCSAEVTQLGGEAEAVVGQGLPLEVGASIHLSCSNKHGAALITSHPSFRLDTYRTRLFAAYMLNNYRSWASFVQDRLERNVEVKDLILVTGRDMTKQWATAAFVEKARSAAISFHVGVGFGSVLGSNRLSFWGSWSSTFLVPNLCGPEASRPPNSGGLSQLRIVGSESSGQRETMSAPNEYNQCVFLRGYRVRGRGIFRPPEVIEAAAEGEGNEDAKEDDPPAPASSTLSTMRDPMADLSANSVQIEAIEDFPGLDSREDVYDVMARFIFDNSDADIALIHDNEICEPFRRNTIATLEELAEILRVGMKENAVVKTEIVGSVKVGRWVPLSEHLAGPSRIRPASVRFESDIDKETGREFAGTKSRKDAQLTSQSGENVLQELFSKLDCYIPPEHSKLFERIGMGDTKDVFKGVVYLAETKVLTKVAVKRICSQMEIGQAVAKSFIEEIRAWKALQHENILSLLGVTTINNILCAVSEWMKFGTMNKYLMKRNNVNILALAHGIARGLEYLHDQGVIHSRLKGANVKIAHDGRPVLSNFGFSGLIRGANTTSLVLADVRWMAPEVLSSEEGEREAHTKASDVWAFGMVLYEALSGKMPFYEQKQAQVAALIMTTQLPSKPKAEWAHGSGSDVLWECCCTCWKQDPKDRPTMSRVRELLKGSLFVEHISSVSTTKGAWMSPAGRFLAIKGDDKRMESALRVVAWSNTEEHIVTLSEDGILRKWNDILQAPVIIAQSAQTREFTRLGFSPDDRLIASFRGKARLWDVSDLSPIWEDPGYWPFVAFHPLKNRIVFYVGNAVLDVNIEDLKNITTTKHKLDFFVYDLVFGPSGDMCVADTDKGVKILSGGSFEEMTSVPYDDHKAVQFTPDGRYILLVLKSKVVFLWDIAAGEVVEKLSVPVDLEWVSEWHAAISRNCRVIQFITTGDDITRIHVLHPKSSYY